MKVYVLTEVYNNGFDGDSVEVYVFDTLEKAQEKMKKDYEYIVNDGEIEECDLDLDNWAATATSFDNSWYCEIHCKNVE